MKIYLSRHAKNRMRKFKIEEEEVNRAIEAPDFTIPGIKERQNAWKKKDNRYIRVTYLKESDKIVVVTVTLKDKPPEGDSENRV